MDIGALQCPCLLTSKPATVYEPEKCGKDKLPSLKAFMRLDLIQFAKEGLYLLWHEIIGILGHRLSDRFWWDDIGIESTYPKETAEFPQCGYSEIQRRI